MRYRILATGILSLGPILGSGSVTAMGHPIKHPEHDRPERSRSGNRKAALL